MTTPPTDLVELNDKPADHAGPHIWDIDPTDRDWRRCTYDGCAAISHRPLRDTLNASACPDTPGGEHQWQPVSFRFETQLLDDHGRVEIRQPSIDAGRVYLVCLPCRSHTYIETAWVGYYLGYPYMEEELDRKPAPPTGEPCP